MIEDSNKKRRTFGEHLTPVQIFKKFILPEIKPNIYKYRWVDFFAGEGNLILPILDLIPDEKIIDFFKNHIFLFDIQEELVEKAIENAIKYNIPEDLAKKNILLWDTLKNFPKFVLNSNLPIYHITNPPYLYIGYIMKHKETERYLELFNGKNEGYQDLYQIALINDLRNDLKKMVYIIPSNFLFGASGSNKIRDDFLKYYNITKAIILEKDIFKYTGVNVIICFFKRKKVAKNEPISFQGFKITDKYYEKKYFLNPKFHYRAGNEFEEFVRQYKVQNPLEIKYYLTIEEVEINKGKIKVDVIDSNLYKGNEYKKTSIFVNKKLYDKIKSNILFIRTVDTGTMDGRAGIYVIKDIFGVDGILVSKAKYRTHPIQIMINPILSINDQLLLMNYFNTLLEYFREITDSEFMTTYKYSDSKYVRKYLGLSQAKRLIETFPFMKLRKVRDYMKFCIKNNQSNKLLTLIRDINKRKDIFTYFNK
ncbi:MAG: N-6 DNA methylase [Candidatus Helarchaeota archaeon]